MARTRWLRPVTPLALVALASSVACSSTLPIPTEPDTLAVVTAAHHAVQSGDDDALCALATSSFSCEQSLIGAPAAPTSPPLVICTWEFRPGGDFQPGRAVHVIGTDGDGNSYDSVLLALQLQEGIRLIDPVYWNDAAVSEGDLNAPAVSPPC